MRLHGAFRSTTLSGFLDTEKVSWGTWCQRQCHEAHRKDMIKFLSPTSVFSTAPLLLLVLSLLTHPLAMWGFLSCQTPRQEALCPLLAPSPAMYIYLVGRDIKAKQMAKFSPELSAALPEQKFEFTTMFLYSWSIKPPAYTDLALKLWIFLYEHS